MTLQFWALIPHMKFDLLTYSKSERMQGMILVNSTHRAREAKPPNSQTGMLPLEMDFALF